MNRLFDNKNFLGLLFMLPAAAFLILFLVYPLGLGIWLSFTDAKIGTPGQFVGLENYEWIIGDSKFQTAVFFTSMSSSSRVVCTWYSASFTSPSRGK